MDLLVLPALWGSTYSNSTLTFLHAYFIISVNIDMPSTSDNYGDTEPDTNSQSKLKIVYLSTISIINSRLRVQYGINSTSK